MDDLSTDELILEFDLARIVFAEEEEEEEEASYVVSLKDITERKRAVEQIEILSRFPAENPNPVLRIAPEGVILYANDASEPLLAIWNAQIGQVVPDDWRMQIKEVSKSGQKKEIEVRCGQRVFSCILAPVVSMSYVNVYCRDITERKQAEEQLRQAKEQYQQLVENINEVIFSLDDGGTIAYVSPAVSALGAYVPTELIGRPFSDFVFPEDLTIAYSGFQRVIGGELGPSEFRMLTKSGNVRWVRSSSKPIVEQGNVVGISGALTDITERKRAEAALRASQEQFRIAQDMSPDGFTILQPVRDAQERVVDFTWIYENAAVARMNGTDPEAVVGKRLLELFPGHRGTPILRAYQQVAESRETCIFEADYSGESMAKPTSFRLVVVPMAGNIAILAQDITERKRAEEALRESEVRFRELFNRMSSGVAVYEAIDSGGDFIFRDFNPAAERIEKVSRKDILGKRVSEAFPGVKAFGVFEVFQRVWQTGKPEYLPPSIYKDERDPGSWRENSVFKLPTGEIVSIYNDITERKRAEEALHVSLEKYRVLFESFPLGITISDKSGKIIEGNRESERLLGITSDAHAQRSIDGKEWQIVRKDGTPMPVDEFASTRALQEDCLIENVEMGIARDNGEITWINVTAAPIPLEGYGVAITYGDITERKFAEGRLKTSREQLHLLAGHLQSVREEERKHLAQEFHDQLGQTLTAIKMDLSMLHRAIADPGKELSRSVIAQGIESSQDMIDRAIAIIREILSELRPELLDQLGIVPTLEWEVERFQRKSGISCTFSSSVEAIDLDPKKAIALYRIFQEAVTNVARHAKATSVVVSLRKEGTCLVLEIKDDGVGISADVEQRARSFGLIGMRERAILLGGTVEISGVEGKGTTVLVRIPYEQTNADGGAAL